MATEIDKRVVEMQFDNKEFEKNCQASLTTLEKLKMALNFDGAKGLESMGKAASKIDLSNLSKGADAVSVRFSAMQVAGMTAIQELTRALINFGKNIWTNTFGQIKSGGWARTLKIDQANFQMKALAENLDIIKQGAMSVTQYMDKMGDAINDAVTGTAYGYDAAAAVASQLMASNITDAEAMEKHLNAIAGAASMTGSTFEDIGRIFTRVASNGRVMGDDLQSLSSRGLNLASTLAKNLGVTESAVRDLVSKGKVSFQQFSDALSDAFGDAAHKADETWSGVTSNVRATLSRIGQLFSDPLVKNLIPVLATIKDKLKEVKTALEPVAKTWTKFIEYITDKSQIFIKGLNGSNIKPVIHSIENVLVAIIEIVWTIGRAIKEVFGSQSINEIKQGVSSLEMFTRSLIPSVKSLESFKEIVKTILIPFKLLWTIGVAVLKYAIGPILKVFVAFLTVLVKLGNAFKPVIKALLDFVSNGEFLSNVLQIIVGTLITLADILLTILDCVIQVISVLTESGTFNLILQFLSTVGHILAKVITVSLTIIFGIINDILSIINPSRIESFFNVIIDVLSLALGMIVTMYETFTAWLEKMSQGDTIFGKILQFLKETWELVKNLFQGNDISGNLNKLQSIIQDLGDKIKVAWEKFKEFLHGMDAGKMIIYAFSIAMILLILSIRGLFDALTGMVKTVTSGIKSLVDIFADIRAFLKGMIKMSPALQVILGLVALLWSFTACMIVLSGLEWDELARAGIALGGFAIGLLALTLVLSKIKFAGFGTSLTLLPAILGLALAICASAAAIALLARADITLKKLVPALIAVAALLALLAGAIVLIQLTAAEINTIIKKNMAAESKKVMVSAGVIVAFAAAVGILTLCLYKLADLPFGEAMRGLAAVAGLMLALATSMAIINWSGAKFGSALGIALFIGSFIILLKSLVKLSELPFGKMIEGLKNAGSVLSMIAIFFTITAIIGKKGGNVLIHNITNLFASLAILVGITTATIFLLKSMKQEDVARGIGVVMLLAVLFTAIVKHLLKSLNSFAGNMKTYKDATILKSFSKFIATFSVCLIALVAAAMIAKKIDLVDVINLAVIMAAFTTAIIFLEKFSAHTKRAKLSVIITFVIGIVTMFSMLALLTLADPDRLYSASLAMIGVLGALTLLAVAAGLTGDKIEKAAKDGKESKFKNAALFATFIAGLIGVIAVLIPLMETTKNMDSGKLTEAVLAIGTVIVAFVVAIGLLAYAADKLEHADNVPKLVGPLIAIAGSMIIIVKAITDLVSHINSDDDGIRAIFATAAVMLAFFAFIKLFQDLLRTISVNDISPKQLLAVAASALIMSSVFAIIATCIYSMTSLFASGELTAAYGLASFGMLFAFFLAITEEFKSLIKATNNQMKPDDMLKVAESVVIMSSVLAIIAASVAGLAVAMHNVGSFTVLGSWGMILSAFTLLAYALSGLCEHIERTELTSTDMLKVAASVVIMSSVLAIITGCITTMSMILSTSPSAIATSILAFVEILGGLAILLIAFKEFLDESKGIDTTRMLAVAGIIDLVSISLLVISGSISMLTKTGSNSPDSIASMLASWFIILSSFAVICLALYMMGQKIDPGKTASAAVSVVIASTAFLIIAGAITSLNNLNVDEGFGKKMAALMIPFGIIVALMAIIAAVGNEINPLSMLAAGAAVLIGAAALLVIGHAMQKAVRAFKGVNSEDIDRLNTVVNKILILLGSIAVIGGLLGAAGGIVGAAAIAGIIALMGAFILFSAGVKTLATAVDIFVDAILKINQVKVDYTTVYRNIRNGIQGACDAIVEARPNMLEALNALFSVVLAAVSSIVGTVVALGVAFFMAFMDGILQALPEALRILSTIMKIIVDWLEEPGNLELFRKFFRSIGAMMVEIISGAIEGLFHIMFELLEEWEDRTNKMKEEAAHNEFNKEANAKMFNKAFNQTGVGPDSDMFYYLQNMRDQQEYLNTLEEGTQQYEEAYKWFADQRAHVFENLDKMTYQDWMHTIDYLNEYAENVKNAGGVLDEEFLQTTRYLQHVAPMEFRDRFNDAVLGIEPAVQELTDDVTVLNQELSAGPNTEGVQHLEAEIEGADSSMSGLADSVEFVNEKLQETADNADVIEYLKEKASGFGEGFKNSLQNIDVKGLAKKWGVDSKKVGSLLGKVTGISFGEEYEESLDYYIEEGNELVLNDMGEYIPKYQAAGYESGEAYAKAMMEGTDEGTTYALKKLAEFLGINLDINDVMEDTIGSFDDFSSGLSGIGDTADETKSKLEEFRDSVKDSLSSAISGIFDEVSEQEYIDPEEMLYRMSENTRRIGEWARNIATLAARGMSEGLLNQLKDMGPQGAAKVQAFVDMTDEQLRMANRRWSAAEFLPDYGTKEIENAYRDAGFNASLGFTEGVDKEAVKQSGIETGKAYDDGVREYLQIESPSKVMEENGIYTVQGLAKGMTSPTSQMFIKAACAKVGSTLVDTIQQSLPKNKFANMGANMLNGLPEGWNKVLPGILSKITSMAAQILARFQSAWRINSPSLAFAEIGEYAMAGLSVGMDKGETEVDDTVERSSSDILNSMKEQLNTIMDGVATDGVYEPVIRPVFDLTAMDQGFNDIQSWFANSQGLNLNGNISRLTPTTREDDSYDNQRIIDAINNINNDDVVNEIGQLRNDISQLQSAMTNLQVVMNTGALVGQLVNPIDSALGMKSLMNTRGRY